MNHSRAFIAGLAFPAVLLPVVYLILNQTGLMVAISLPLQFQPLFLPIIFGFWNVLYFAIGRRNPVKAKNSRLWVTGIILGLIMASFVVFVSELPELIFGITGGSPYLPLIIAPVIYGLIWRYVVNSINNLVGLQDFSD